MVQLGSGDGFALQDVTTSCCKATFGHDALWDNTGVGNSAFGYRSMRLNVGAFFGEFFGTIQAALLALGTSLLFLADTAYSIHRFKPPLETIIGPILCSPGRLPIALSLAYFSAP